MGIWGGVLSRLSVLVDMIYNRKTEYELSACLYASLRTITRKYYIL